MFNDSFSSDGSVSCPPNLRCQRPRLRNQLRVAVLLCMCVALAPAADAANHLASGASLQTGGVLISGNGHYTLANQVAVAASSSTSYALTSAGIVWSWGYYYDGALGDGSASTRSYAAPVPGLTDVVAIAAGNSHVLALKSNHSIWAWGRNTTNAQLGIGATSPASWYPVEAAAVGMVQAIASSLRGDNSYAIRADGSVIAWGDNQFGQVGNGTTGSYQAAPVIVSNVSATVGVAGGSSTGFAWNASGAAWAWGYNGNGRLGDGTTLQRTTPSAIASPMPLQAISAGGSHTLGISANGTPLAWGWNGAGQLGDGTMTSHAAPSGVPNLAAANAIGAGANFSAAVLADGSVWAWGDNY